MAGAANAEPSPYKSTHSVPLPRLAAPEAARGNPGCFSAVRQRISLGLRCLTKIGKKPQPSADHLPDVRDRVRQDLGHHLISPCG